VRRSAVAAALVTALAVSLGCRREAPETRFLNFDPESSAGSLTAGWSGWEKTPEGDTFAWAQAREATLAAVSRADGDRLVRFRCWPFRYAGAPPQTLTLTINGAKIDTVTLADGNRVYTMPTPQAAWKNGVNEIRLAFVYAEAPKDRMPPSGDARTLSAGFDWLEIVPPIPPAPEKK